MEKNSNIFSRENLVYLIIWIMVFAMPIFLSTGGDNFDWIRVQHETIRIFPFFLIFLLNNFILFKFFKKKQYLNYSILIIIAVVVFSFIASFNVEIYRILDIPRPRNPKPLIVPHHQENQLIEFFNRFFYNVIFSILVLGFNNAFKILTIWFDDKRNFEQLQKEKLQIELEVLKNQISPHFLMNTLNNIHALIDYDKEIAKESVVKLSKLMRVLLYDSENENYSIKNEVQFLNDYISLMKIRVNDNVDIRFNYPLNIGDVKIPPLLFVSFVENAFKHGIKAIGDSYVHIELSSLDDKIFFSVSNSKSEKNSEEQNSKIGLENSRRRFDAIFNNNYSFDILETNDNFTVKISIPTIWK